MKTIFQLTKVVIVIVMVTGCSISESAETINEQLLSDETNMEESLATETNSVELPGNTTSKEFSFSVNDTIITLNDWHDTDDILGTPLSSDVITAENSDTYTGSFFKTLDYDGLQIKLFSPVQNSKQFRIYSMYAFKEGYRTFKGIEVGDTLNEMKNAYPELKFDRNKQVFESFDEMESAYIQFEVVDELISGIKIYSLDP